jgi:peptidyl-prolyl cis-trans isomerase C
MTSPTCKALLAASTMCALFAHAEPQPAPQLAPAHPLVTGTSVQVTKGDFDIELRNVPDSARVEFLTSAERINRMLERIFLNKAAAAKAAAEGFDKDPAVMAELDYARQNKLAALYLKKLVDAIPVPNLEVRAREQFLVNADKLATPEMVRASHILIALEKHTRDEAKKLAEDIRQKALAGENFEKLAETYSEDPSVKTNKGDVGLFPAEKMVPEFSQAAFALKNPGDISPIVQSHFGYHIIRFTSRTPRKPAVYEDHRRELLEQEQQQYREAQANKLVKALMEDQKPRLDEKAAETLRMKLDHLSEKITTEIQQQQKEQAKASASAPAPSAK